MKMSIECAMEIWASGGGVAAADWQEKTGYAHSRYAYRRRPTPVFCKEYSRAELEDYAKRGVYYRSVLECVTKKYPRVRKIIAVHEPVQLAAACRDAGIPEPQMIDGHYAPGKVVASQATWEGKTRRFSPAPRPTYAWQDAAKRLAPAMAAGS